MKGNPWECEKSVAGYADDAIAIMLDISKDRYYFKGVWSDDMRAGDMNGDGMNGKVIQD